jgi:hypothetical protein
MRSAVANFLFLNNNNIWILDDGPTKRAREIMGKIRAEYLKFEYTLIL